MRVCGVICEYNPFHNGHAHHLSQARRLTGADYVVCA
ncbi:MAG: nucleotidyltransferase family protein, partial [Candidatus Spyradocola sp.]